MKAHLLYGSREDLVFYIINKACSSEWAIFFENGNVTVPQGNYFSSEFTITFWAKFDSLDYIEFFYFGNGYMDVIDIFFQESIFLN